MRNKRLGHTGQLLLQPGGHRCVLRSITKMSQLRRYKPSSPDEAEQAERYFRRYHRVMDDTFMKSHGCPIGGSVLKSACKQIVSEQTELSGMR